jgi:hypothetical protein
MTSCSPSPRPLDRRFGLCTSLVLAGWMFTAPASAFAASPGPEPLSLKVASFRCDATPPAGEPLLWATNLMQVLDPLLAKGVVLQDGSNRFVLCALDWCLLANESQRSFRAAIARAADTEPGRVAVQCVHQHAAPYADEAAHRLLDAASEPLPHLSTKFLDAVRARLAGAVQEAMGRLEPFDRVGTGEAPVERVASIRRLRGEKGQPLVRYSNSGKDPKMAAAPEGPIDPALKTITLARGDWPLARLHYYASHPQTFACDGRASADFVGRAREELEQREKVPQIYFTGCSGDVTVGKYNDGSPRARLELMGRLCAGMEAAIARTRFTPAEHLLWRTELLTLPLRTNRETVMAQSRAWLANPKQSDGMRAYEGAMRLAFVERLDQPLELSALQIGNMHILHLPGEPMLEYQLFAQRAKPDHFVAVAGYGDCGPAYICTDQALGEGGYEPTATNVGLGSEGRLKQAIRRLLAAAVP